MKEKMVYLVIGILIGAIITAGCFMLFSKNGKRPMDGDMPRGGMENRVKGERTNDLKEPTQIKDMENNL